MSEVSNGADKFCQHRRYKSCTPGHAMLPSRAPFGAQTLKFSLNFPSSSGEMVAVTANFIQEMLRLELEKQTRQRSPLITHITGALPDSLTALRPER